MKEEIVCYDIVQQRTFLVQPKNWSKNFITFLCEGKVVSDNPELYNYTDNININTAVLLY